MRTTRLFVLPAAAVTCLLFAAAALAAQRERVFVASYGSDSNPCTFGSPCKTFQFAHDTVAAGGEVTAIDSAGFGPLAITKAITITSPAGIEAGIAAPATGISTAITINTPSSATVVLSGLTLEGANSAHTGINYGGAGNLEIVNCVVRNYVVDGINVEPTSGSPSVLISNTIVSGGSNGIFIFAPSGTIQAALDHVTIGNSNLGLGVETSGEAVEVQVSDSHIDNNGNYGIFTSGSSTAATVNVILSNVTLNQTPPGIDLVGHTNMWLSGVTQTAVPAFTSVGVNFDGTSTANAAFSDNTNHLMGGVSGGMLQAWTKQ